VCSLKRATLRMTSRWRSRNMYLGRLGERGFFGGQCTPTVIREKFVLVGSHHNRAFQTHIVLFKLLEFNFKIASRKDLREFRSWDRSIQILLVIGLKCMYFQSASGRRRRNDDGGFDRLGDQTSSPHPQQQEEAPACKSQGRMVQ